jgi:hypothetical protein
LPENQKPANIRTQKDSLIQQISKPVKADSTKALPKKDIAVNLPKPRIDSTVLKNNQQLGSDTTAIVDRPKPRTDSVKLPPVSVPKIHSSGYLIDSMNKHFVVIVLQKVDPLFVTEVKNAFYRYGRERYPTLPLEYTVMDFDADRKFLVINSFPTSKEAKEYIQRAIPASASEIMPWLAANKYSFTLITETNLQLLLEKKDLDAYTQFLEQTLQVK